MHIHAEKFCNDFAHICFRKCEDNNPYHELVHSQLYGEIKISQAEQERILLLGTRMSF